MEVHKMADISELIYNRSGATIGELSKTIQEVDAKVKPIVLCFTNYQCNANCGSCYAGADKSGRLFDKELFYDVKDVLSSQGYEIHATGAEQTLEKDIIEFYSRIGKKDIITNGLWRLGVPDLLREAGITTVRISLHGDSAALQDAYFGIPVYDSTVKAIEVAKREGFEVQTETVISNENWEHASDIGRLAWRLGSDRVNYLFFIPSGRGSLERNTERFLLSAEQKKEALDDILELRADSPGLKVRFFGGCGPNYFGESIYKHHRGEIPGVSNEGGSYCKAGDKFLVVDPYGDIYPCIFFLKDPKYRIGKYHKGVGLVLEGKEKFLEEKNKTHPGCGGCQAEPICKGGCAGSKLHDKNHTCLTKLVTKK
jgi:radical SAM protein with 4Fe4S-binding SPASM domain